MHLNKLISHKCLYCSPSISETHIQAVLGHHNISELHVNDRICKRLGQFMRQMLCGVLQTEKLGKNVDYKSMKMRVPNKSIRAQNNFTN